MLYAGFNLIRNAKSRILESHTHIETETVEKLCEQSGHNMKIDRQTHPRSIRVGKKTDVFCLDALT